MLFKQSLGRSNVTSLAERVRRFIVLLKNPRKRTRPVLGKIMKSVRDLPHLARKSITFDRGTEFVSWPHLQAGIGTQTWFCDPSSPWQKGTVENTNRCVRRWLPRKRDIAAGSDHELKMICDRLNNTPRKCLGWKKLADDFREKIMAELGRSPYPKRQQECRFRYRSKSFRPLPGLRHNQFRFRPVPAQVQSPVPRRCTSLRAPACHR